MDGFNTLQELGAQSISATTHIPKAFVENILNKDFDNFQKPQFFGFISILEREYKIDLSEMKQEFLFARAQEEITEEVSFDIAEKSSKLFENRKELLKNKKFIYGAAGTVVVLLIVVLLSTIDFSSPTQEEIEINNTAIDQAKKNLNIAPVHVANVEDMMQNNEVESAEFGQDAQEANSTTQKEKNVQDSTTKASKKTAEGRELVGSNEPTMPLYFRIVPKGRLWLGIINTETHRRSVETISEPLILDAEKSWLIVTGYGHLDMDCGDTTTKHRVDHKLLFLYEGGICQIIDKEEFKARNRGKLW